LEKSLDKTDWMVVLYKYGKRWSRWKEEVMKGNIPARFLSISSCGFRMYILF
jgi:hypothetical protein